MRFFHTTAYYGRGNAFYVKNDLVRAIDDYSQAIILNPEGPRTYYYHFYRGLVYDGKGDHDKAITDYKRVIELEPNFIEAYALLGNAYDDSGEFDKALASYEDALALNPERSLRALILHDLAEKHMRGTVMLS